MRAFLPIMCISALWVLFLNSMCLGQASEAEMRSFPMPPPSGFVATKTFGHAGDYGYYTAPTSSLPGVSANPADYKYVRYLGADRKRVFLYGAWGPTGVPARSPGADACSHAHVSYGVWARYQAFLSREEWRFLGGGGMSGKRNASDRCVFDPDNPLRSIDARYGWGWTFLELDLRWRYFESYREIVVGVLSNTHGWGSCPVPPRTFKACFEPSYIIGYTLP